MYRKGCEFSHGPYGLGQTHATMAITMELSKAARQSRANPERLPQFGLFFATWEHEVGIISNHRLACCGEYVPWPYTHCPLHLG